MAAPSGQVQARRDVILQEGSHAEGVSGFPSRGRLIAIWQENAASRGGWLRIRPTDQADKANCMSRDPPKGPFSHCKHGDLCYERATRTAEFGEDMPLYRHTRNLVLFVHIPKTGGSTVEEVLVEAGASQALKYHKLLGFSNSTPQHMHWEIMRAWLPPGFYDYAFAVVRHPLNRLVSEYHYRVSLSQKPLLKFDAWVNQKLGQYDENPYVNDNHIRPQTSFLGAGVEVFKMEDGLEAPIHAGLRKLGIPTDFVKIHHARKSEKVAVDVTEQTLERIRNFYAVDFTALNYDPEKIPSLLNVKK